MQTYIDVSSRSHFSKYYLKPLLSSGKLEMMFQTNPKAKTRNTLPFIPNNQEAGHWVSFPIVLLLFIPDYIRIIYPYIQSRDSEIIYPPSYNLVYSFNCNCKWSRYCFSSFQIFAQLLFQFLFLFIGRSDFPF